MQARRTVLAAPATPPLHVRREPGSAVQGVEPPLALAESIEERRQDRQTQQQVHERLDPVLLQRKALWRHRRKAGRAVAERQWPSQRRTWQDPCQG